MSEQRLLRIARWLGPVALAPLLGACALGPQVPKSDTRLPSSYESSPANPPPTASSETLDRWWLLYDDPQLNSLIATALRDAPDARIALSRLTEARAIRTEALSAYAPQGGIGGNVERVKTKTLSGPPPVDIPGVGAVSLDNAGAATEYGANFDVSWEIDLFGRRRAERKTADADLAAARFEIAAAIASLEANVADLLFVARGLALDLADARRMAEIDHQLLDAAQRRDAGGVVNRSDVDEAATVAAQADANVADLEGQLRATRRSMLVLIGRGADPITSFDPELRAGTPPEVPVSVPGELLARRPDVREAAERVTSAAGTLTLDKLALLPKLTVQPDVGLSSSLTLGLPVTSTTSSVGVSITQAVFDIPRLRAEIRAQGARAVDAVINYEHAIQVAYGEAENAFAKQSADATRLTRLTSAESFYREAYDGAIARDGAGVDSKLETMAAERDWLSAHSALVDTRTQTLRQSVQTFKALGGGVVSTAA